MIILPQSLKRLTALLLFVFSGIVSANAQPAPIEALSVTTSKGKFIFQTELAMTAEQKARGLMFRHKLPKNRAMLFVWSSDRKVSMWMKNTRISLDMVFMYRNGKVAGITRATKPFSLDIISSPGNVAGVLEIAAGRADEIGLKAGDKLVHRLFAQ